MATPKRRRIEVGGGAQRGVDGAVRRLLGGEADVDGAGPGLLDVVADGRAGARAEDEDERAEAGGQRVAGQQVDDGFAGGPDGGQRLHAAVATGPPGGQHDQRR